MSSIKSIGVVTLALGISAPAVVSADQAMSFFITSVGPGDGANLGGLEGADAHCASLAQAAGSEITSWKAYLSTTPVIDRSVNPMKITPGVNARDRIGNGPWYNAKGELIAENVEALHANSGVNKKTGLDENGNMINGRGDSPNRHDILTGSDTLGQYSTAGGDTTCGNWTSNAEGSAIVGHHDRVGLNDSWNMISWNSSHGSRGCGKDDLPKSGGDGLFYCFAAE